MHRALAAAGLSTIALALVPILAYAAIDESPVADAAMRADRQLVLALIKRGADVNAVQGDGMTALHWAAMNDDLELAQVLIHAGSHVSAATRLDAYTPILIAARNGNAAILEALLKAGADAKAPTTNGASALMLAAASGSADAAKMLLDHGADVNAKERDRGETALMFAAAANRASVIEILMQHSADSTIATRVVDVMKLPPTGQTINVDRQQTNRELVGMEGGLTALMFAARQGALEAVQALIDAGAQVNQVSPADGTSPLLIATINGRFDVAKYLLDHGADPNLASAAGCTPLYATLNVQWVPHSFYPQPTSQTQQKTTYLELMTALLEHGAKPNIQIKKKLWYNGYNFDLSGVDETGSTPFWRAAQATDLAAMGLLLHWGSDPTIVTSPRERRGRKQPSPGGDAAKAGGASPGVNALQVAAGTGWDGNFNANAPGGWMPSVKFLVEELGFDVNAADNKGSTPLHYAAARGDNEMILYLVSKGANVRAVNTAGQTVADMANGPTNRVQPFPETIALLEKLGSKNNHRCVSCGEDAAEAPSKGQGKD